MSQKNLIFKYILLPTLSMWIGICYAQNVIKDMNSELTYGDSSSSFTESINIISRSGKVFILSNNNQLLNKGDFITMSLEGDGPVARAVVAKNHEGKSGIKIIKVYSLSRWKQLAKGTNVLILKGDDSILFKPKAPKKEVAQEDTPSIETEEDLFNDVDMENEDLNSFYKDNRLIKPDSILGAALSTVVFTDYVNNNEEVGGYEFSFTYAYQFNDNFWLEGLYGYTLVNAFPDATSQLIIHEFSARLKYTIAGPLYSYFLPYIGFRSVITSSALGTTDDDTVNELELQTKDEIEGSSVTVGVTVLKRLVPGWFFKADLGTDIISGGFAIEF